MRLINRCSCRLSGPAYGFHDQVRLIAVVILACMLVHLALFQLADASKQSSSLLVGNDNDNAPREERSRGQAVISLVPKEDRGLFIIYHLAKALNTASANGNSMAFRTQVEPDIPQKKSKTFKDIQTYETFSTDLLKWTMRTYGLSQSNVNSLVRKHQVLCTSRGLCFNPNDIGSMCCPF